MFILILFPHVLLFLIMSEKQSVLIALGTFDGLHIGHKAVLFSNKNYYDKRIALLFTEHPQKLLAGKNPGELLTRAKKEKLLNTKEQTENKIQKADEFYQKLMYLNPTHSDLHSYGAYLVRHKRFSEGFKFLQHRFLKEDLGNVAFPQIFINNKKK